MKKIEEGTSFQGYWVKNDKVYDVTNSSHIKFIIEHPEWFELTLEELHQIYNKYGEKFRAENKAREFIIRSVAKLGWVRVRHYTKPIDYWSIQCDSIARRSNTIKDFIYWGVENHVLSYNDSAVLIGYNNENDIEKFDFNSGGIKNFLIESNKKREYIIKELTLLTKKARMSETSLARVLHHFQNGFFIISAFKDDLSLQQNYNKHIELKRLLKEMQLGFFELIGYWDQEMYNKMVVQEDSSDEDINKVSKSLQIGKDLHLGLGGFDMSQIELSCFVPYNINNPHHYTYTEFLLKAESLRRHFFQDSFMALDIKDDTVKLLNYDKKESISLGQLSIRKISYAYSRLRKNPEKSFLFENVNDYMNNKE
jgi:hypothetical protein